MVPSVYVIQKSSNMMFCVSKAHYELYKDSYELCDRYGIKETNIIDNVTEAPIESKRLSDFDITETLAPVKRGRPSKKEK